MSFVSAALKVLMAKGLTRKEAKEVFNSVPREEVAGRRPQWIVSRQYDRYCLRKGHAPQPNTYRPSPKKLRKLGLSS